MEAVKMNVFHWHLSDDQGFRVESRRFPRLQKFGSDGMYYTQSEIRDIVAYAHERGIRIVPEFDMPGHATSWLVGYPKLGSRPGSFQLVRQGGILSDLLDPTQEYTYRFIDRLVGEMTTLFPDEYFHIGGDEVDPKQWLDNPRIQRFMQKHHMTTGAQLQAYFNSRLVKIIAKHHRIMIGWDEVLQPDLPKNVVIQSWRGQASLWQAAQQGHRAILSAGYYLDLMYPASYHYSVDPLKPPPPAPGRKEPVQMPAITVTPEIESRILGGEAAMWEELASPENLDAKLWPRLAAIAERLWSPEADIDTASMYQRLELVDHWLEWVGTKQNSNLKRMRERLVREHSSSQLDLFASILEPVKGYKRHSERYSIFTPLNRLVDAIPPESVAARHFREDVDVYLAGPHADTTKLRRQLVAWSENAAAIRPTLEDNSLLHEQLAVDDAVTAICQAGLDALSLLEKNLPPSADWKSKTAAAVDKASAPGADVLVQIAPGVKRLIAAVPAPVAASGSSAGAGTDASR
jgi:hexosaminidase